MGTELFHADGRTGMEKLTVAFRNFTNAPKNWSVLWPKMGFVTDHVKLTDYPTIAYCYKKLYALLRNRFKLYSDSTSSPWGESPRRINVDGRLE